MHVYKLKAQVLFVLLLITTHTYCQVEDNEEHQNSLTKNSLSINTNLATWIIGIPSLGVSYRVSDRNELLLDASYSRWNFERKGRPRYWRSWNFSPQFRSYVNHDRNTYVGAQFSVGQYNISSQVGKYLGGGLIIGKQYQAGKSLLIDLGLTLGYLRFRDRASYTYHNTVFYKNRVKEDSNYWGPTSVSIKLSRKIN
ncbi:DUF3575 domain-containing protein [Sphingobacterium bovistauri]|uniref:DUF3575 domain-containing protein n=1 Tax=Sphingobacterium bovistauri TaxID=2781959 RepID=A0ABS7Z7X6_9SPHI|nr:DUF3575 domain-containing protein [Sphingobacterium bovistauri]MCA5006259.1 DUF3575 domain-containing protein [Sphingobacterium bovistauri]